VSEWAHRQRAATPGPRLTLADLVARATCPAAAQIGRADELGTLAVGRVADVSVLRLEAHD
jgi:imidazolonepropionase-like amidohydrolase